MGQLQFDKQGKLVKPASLAKTQSKKKMNVLKGLFFEANTTFTTLSFEGACEILLQRVKGESLLQVQVKVISMIWLPQDHCTEFKLADPENSHPVIIVAQSQLYLGNGKGGSRAEGGIVQWCVLKKSQHTSRIIILALHD